MAKLYTLDGILVAASRMPLSIIGGILWDFGFNTLVMLIPVFNRTSNSHTLTIHHPRVPVFLEDACFLGDFLHNSLQKYCVWIIDAHAF
jgi:hypothetical protein